MYGKTYEPKKVLHRKKKRLFPKEVVKEVNSGEDLFTVFYAEKIKEIKQQAKCANRTERNDKRSENFIKRTGLNVVHEVNESVEFPNLMDPFDALLKAQSCQPPDNESGTKNTLELCKKSDKIVGRSKLSLKNNSFAVLNKENIPGTPCGSPPDPMKENKRISTSGTSKRDKNLMLMKDSQNAEYKNHRKNIETIPTYKPKLYDSYINPILEDSSDEYITEETLQRLQRPFPRSLTSFKHLIRCKKPSSDDVHSQSPTMESGCVFSSRGESVNKLILSSSTPVRHIKHANGIPCQLSPVLSILTNCFKEPQQKDKSIGNERNKEEEEEENYKVPADDCTLSTICNFEDLCLNSESNEDRPQMLCEIPTRNPISENSVVVGVEESCRNDKIVAHQNTVSSPDPFMEFFVSDIQRGHKICETGVQGECLVSSVLDETPHTLRAAIDRSALDTNAYDYSNGDTTFFNLGKTEQSRADSSRIFSDNLYDNYNTTNLDSPSGKHCHENDEYSQNIPNPFSPCVLSNVNCRRPGSGSKYRHCPNLSHPTVDSRNITESTIQKWSSASNNTAARRRSHVVVPLESYVFNVSPLNTDFREMYICSTSLLHATKSDNSILENVTSGASNEVEVTFKNVVLQHCSETKIFSFAEAFPESNLVDWKKIGEGVYGEVFSCHSDGMPRVLKIMPIEGDCQINGEPQKSYKEILSEIVITMELSNLRKNEEFFTANFPELVFCWCVQGAYPSQLLTLWHKYNEEKTSENDSPEILPEDQIYIILELANVGSALESYVFNSAEQSLSAFMQVAYTLAVAEAALEFEHRDLHWGNILIKPTKERKILYKLNGENHGVQSHGIQASVIDFTLSRMTYDGCCIYNNLADDPALFEGQGDYQFDIYRLMQVRVEDKWHVFDAYNNVLWLSYVLEKLITEVHYRNKSSKVHARGMAKLRQLRNKIIDFKSAQDIALSFTQGRKPK